MVKKLWIYLISPQQFTLSRLRRELKESVQSQMEAMPAESLAPLVGDGGEDHLLENLQRQLQSTVEVGLYVIWVTPFAFNTYHYVILKSYILWWFDSFDNSASFALQFVNCNAYNEHIDLRF